LKGQVYAWLGAVKSIRAPFRKVSGGHLLNLHAPGSECGAKQENLEGAFGIPECMPPVRRDFQGKKSPQPIYLWKMEE